MRATVLGSFFCALATLTLACGDDNSPSGAAGSGGSGGTGGASADAGGGRDGNVGADGSPPTEAGVVDSGGGSDSPMPMASAARGEHLAKNVLGCIGCHTPRGMMGLDMSKLLAGTVGDACFRDTNAMDATMGCIRSPNLTNHETGLKNATDEQIIDMITKGARSDGKYLFTNMPWALYANLTADDARSIVLYLRTVPGVDNMVMASQPPWNNRATMPAVTAVLLSDPNAIPEVPANAMNAASANLGRYLTSLACVECHSPAQPMGQMPAHVFDPAKAFEGGRLFGPPNMGPYSANLTPDDTGLKAWTAADIEKALTMGLDREGKKVCSPMGTYPGLTAEEIKAISDYLMALPAKKNMIPMMCAM